MTRLTPAELTRLGESYLASVRPLSSGRAHVVDKMPANFLHAGLIHLSRCSNLVQLTLIRTKVTDACLAPLSGFAQLRFLELGGTQVTEEGAQKLEAALPRCRINR